MLGQCWECYWEVEGICGLSIEGDTGWTGSAPACGSSATYVNDAGEDCSSRSCAGPGCKETCEESCYMADIDYDRTQACH